MTEIPAAKVVFLDAPQDKTWGVKGKVRSIYLRDPDGNLIELASYK